MPERRDYDLVEKSPGSKICVLIPAYNAADTIGQVVACALRFVPDVIVADDGSMDGTYSAAINAGASVIKIPENKGKGNALKTLFKKAVETGYDAAIAMDADAQHDPHEIPLFIKAHYDKPEDIIIGSRMSEREKIPRARYNSMHVARFYISLASNQFIEDTQCGYRLYPLSAVKKLNLFTERYVTETEILMKAGDSGIKISFIKIKAIYDNGGKSHFRGITDIAKITTYVMSYLTIKWLIEGISSNPFTYNKDRSLRDFFNKIKTVDFILRVIAVITALPISLFLSLEYILLKPFVGNNFMSLRKLNKSFLPIVIATHMLPVLLIIAITEKACGLIGLRFRIIDRVIETCYPDLWNP